MINLTLQEIRNNQGAFKEKFGQALTDGFFYIEIPETIREKVKNVMQYATGIRSNEALVTADLGNPRLGFQERQGTQAVAFSAMSNQWEQVFPNETVEVAKVMNDLAVEILKSALQHLSIPEDAWSEATGKLTDGYGSNVFSLNHYKPGEQKIGLIPHKDMGWITVLFIDKAGLETSKDGINWVGIPAKENYFVINFGRAFELLVNSVDKLRASLHHVHRLEEERASFGIFINHTEGSSIFQMGEQGTLAQIGTYEEYLNQCFSEFMALQQQFKKEA